MSRCQFNFHYTFRIRYSEVDAQGIVFNAHYLTYFDCTMTEYLRDINYDYVNEVKERQEDFHTIKTTVEYKQPILFDSIVDCWAKVQKIGNSSVTFFMELHTHKKEDLLAIGEVIWVNTNQVSKKPCRIPELLRKKILKLEKEL